MPRAPRKKVTPLDSSPALSATPDPASGVVAKPPKPDFEIHATRVTLRKVEGVDAFEAASREYLCKQRVPGTATAVLSPLDHPAFCALCKAELPKLPKGTRVETLMVRPPQ